MRTFTAITASLTAIVLLFVLLYDPETETTSSQLLALATFEDEFTGERKGLLTLSAAVDNKLFYTDSDSQHIYMMVSATADSFTGIKERSPLNISLVLDRSGSMNGNGKLDYVKKAAQLVVDNLEQDDQLSVVDYDDNVEVLYSQARVTNKAALKAKIAELYPDGSTNLSGGMLEGYNQVVSTITDRQVNRVLLLSDGLANQGITVPSELIRLVEAKYKNENVAISTFGVGADFNEDIMTDLAENGMGNYYFIDEADKIPEIFAKELNGLLNVVAQNTELKIAFPPTQLDVVKVYGYEHQENNGTISIDLNDVYSKEEKMVLVKFKIKGELTKTLSLTSTLSYDDVVNEYDREVLSAELEVSPTNDKAGYTASRNETVLQHLALFHSNEVLELATQLVDRGEYDKARELVNLNQVRMDSTFVKIGKNEKLDKLYKDNSLYRDDLENVEQQSSYDRKMMQKSNKSKVYNTKKNKK